MKNKIEVKIEEEKIKKDIGKRLKAIRNFHGLKPTQMAKIMGIERNTYSEYESGVTKPSLVRLKTLAINFKISTDFILNIDNLTDVYTYSKLSIYKEQNNIPYMKSIRIIDNEIYGIAWNYTKNEESYTRLNCDLFYEVENNHMSPMYMKGSIVYINTSISQNIRQEALKSKFPYLISVCGLNYVVLYNMATLKHLIEFTHLII